MNLNALSQFFRFKLNNTVFQDCFSPKYLTAQIFDELGTWYVVPLKQRYVIDGKFLVRLGSRLLMLSIEQSKIYTYRHRAARAVQTLLYSTKDRKPIDLADHDVIEEFCKLNNIEHIDLAKAILIQAVNTLNADRDENDAAVIGLTETVEKLMANIPQDDPTRQGQYSEYMQAVREIGADGLKGPTAPISRYLASQLADSPETLGNVIVVHDAIKKEWVKVANPAKTPFNYLLLVVGLVAAAIAIGALVYWFGAGGGSSPDILSQIEQFQQQGLSPADVGIESKQTPDPAPAPAAEDAPKDIFDTVADFSDDLLDPPAAPAPAPAAEPDPVAANQTQFSEQEQEILAEMERQRELLQGNDTQ